MNCPACDKTITEIKSYCPRCGLIAPLAEDFANAKSHVLWKKDIQLVKLWIKAYPDTNGESGLKKMKDFLNLVNKYIVEAEEANRIANSAKSSGMCSEEVTALFNAAKEKADLVDAIEDAFMYIFGVEARKLLR